MSSCPCPGAESTIARGGTTPNRSASCAWASGMTTRRGDAGGPGRRHGEFAGHVLRTAESERPVLRAVLDVADEDVFTADADGLEPLGDRGVQLLLDLVGAAALGEDLDDDGVGAVEAEAGVLRDDGRAGMGRDDLEPVPHGDAVGGDDRVMDRGGDLGRVGTSVAVIDAHERHEIFLWSRPTFVLTYLHKMTLRCKPSREKEAGHGGPHRSGGIRSRRASVPCALSARIGGSRAGGGGREVGGPCLRGSRRSTGHRDLPVPDDDARCRGSGRRCRLDSPADATRSCPSAGPRGAEHPSRSRAPRRESASCSCLSPSGSCAEALLEVHRESPDREADREIDDSGHRVDVHVAVGDAGDAVGPVHDLRDGDRQHERGLLDQLHNE
ncbi:hypothetical protein FF38_03559, partial [Lucilia cuprina]